MNLADVMDEIAERLRQAPSLAGRTYAYPKASISPPAAIVSYPTNYNFDESYGRGLDRITGGMVFIAVGNVLERQSRDLLTKYVSGSGDESVKQLLEAEGYTSCDFVHVSSVDFDTYTIGAVDYLTAIFELDIVGPGSV